MQDTKIIIENTYINKMAEYYEKQGKQLQRMADAYIAAMQRVVGEGITTGETSDALELFLEYAKKLHQVIGITSMGVRDSAMNYLEEIDTQDQYRS